MNLVESDVTKMSEGVVDRGFMTQGINQRACYRNSVIGRSAAALTGERCFQDGYRCSDNFELVQIKLDGHKLTIESVGEDNVPGRYVARRKSVFIQELSFLTGFEFHEADAGFRKPSVCDGTKD